MIRLLEVLKPSFLSISVAFIVLFIIAVLHANMSLPNLPITVKNSEAVAWYGREVVVLEYKRQFIITEPFIGTVIRSVKCDNGRSYDLPDSTRRFSVGNYRTHRSLVLPYTIIPGTICAMATSVAWQPPLSFIRYIQDIEDVSFTVSMLGEPDKKWLPTNEEGE